MARLVALVVGSVLLLGCGGNAPNKRPADFSLTVSHKSGSVPPPYHIEWTLDVRPGGRGEIEYLPDYPGPRTPHWRERFRVPPAALDRVYAELRDHDLMRDDFSRHDAPPGASLDTASILAAGTRYDLPGATEDGDSPLAPVLDDLRALVPADVWRSLVRRRARYDDQLRRRSDT